MPTKVLQALTYYTEHFYRPKTVWQKFKWAIRGLFPVSWGTLNKAIEGIMHTQLAEAQERVETDTIIVQELNKHSVILGHGQSKQSEYNKESPNKDDPSYG